MKSTGIVLSKGDSFCEQCRLDRIGPGALEAYTWANHQFWLDLEDLVKQTLPFRHPWYDLKFREPLVNGV